jgi:3-oxoacyl-[acyl-carrier-protein] synthase III
MMAEIAVAAAKQALERAGKTAADVDGVICASANMQRAYPAMAVEIQTALGIQGFGFDMNVACSSATFGIEMAVNAVKSGAARAVLVVDPEITSAHLAWKDRDCHFIFGDVCTAILVERLENAPPGAFEVLGTRLLTTFSNAIRNNAGFMSRAEDRDPDERDQLFYQEGRRVFKEVCPLAAQHMTSHLADLGFTTEQVRRFWLHQANLSMNQFIVRKMLGRDATARRGAGDPGRIRQHRLGRLHHRLPPPQRRLQGRRRGRDLLLRRGLLDRQRGGAPHLSALPRRALSHTSQRYSPSRFGTAARGQVCSAINNAWLGCGTA